jgi:hypothetical protein
MLCSIYMTFALSIALMWIERLRKMIINLATSLSLKFSVEFGYEGRRGLCPRAPGALPPAFFSR